MPIYFGRTENSELSIGGVGIGEGYVGNVQVFSSGPPPWIFIGEETGWMPGKRVTSAYRNYEGLHTAGYNPEKGYDIYGCDGHTKGEDCQLEVRLQIDTKTYHKVYLDGEITHNMNGKGTRYCRYYQPSTDHWTYFCQSNDEDWISKESDVIATREILTSSDDYIIMEMKAGFSSSQVEDVSVWIHTGITRLIGQ